MSNKKHDYSEKGHKGFLRRKDELSNKQLSTYVTESEYSDLIKLLKRHKLKRTDFIREAIRNAVKELKEK